MTIVARALVRPFLCAASPCIALLCVSVLCAGCAPDPVVVEARFPTPNAFMQSSSGRLRVFPLTREQLGICPDLLDDLQGSSFAIDPVFDSGRQDPCWFRNAASLPDFAPGPHAFVVEMREESNTLILQGCAIGEIYVDAANITVELDPTDDYDPAIVAPGTPESRCGGGT